MKAAIKSIEAKAVNYLLRHIPRTKTSDVFSPSVESAQDEVEDIFTSSSGTKIPVLKHHRYSLKKCWSVFGPVAGLSELKGKGLLSEDDQKYLKDVIGHRTITDSFMNIRARLTPYVEKYSNLFVTTTIPDIGKRLLKPSLETAETLISKKTVQHRALIEKINGLVTGKKISGQYKILEIGYTSGGESIIGFERLGFQAFGIDNFYYDSVKSTSRHEIIRDLTKTKVTFDVGDITTRTGYEEDSLALVYSLSVIEHIADLPAAFDEMFRILRPGGVMFHRYDPFFHIGGAHSHASLDSPWAHMRMNDDDLEHYIRLYRPNEAEVSLPWIKNALNRRHTMNYIQNAVSKAGFKIRLWDVEYVSDAHRSLLTPDIISDCLIQNDNITIADLCGKAVSFIAEKPAK